MLSQPDIAARPLLIGGMHRSGTSLTASLFASAGIDLGPRLLGANESNPLGHFEDLGIQEFHARALVAQGLGSEGYTASSRGAVPAALEREADDLLAERVRPGIAWGWKEPRTTLFLDFWQARLPEARHVFVFRPPWEVADSLFRRGDGTFVLNPTFALDVWTHYNRLIVDFARRHPAHCLVFDIAQVIADPNRVVSAVRSQFGLPLNRPASRYREEMFTRDGGATHAAIVRTIAPDAWAVYRDLSDLAEGAADAAATPSRDLSMADCAVLEWARASRAQTQTRQTAEREARLQAEIEAQRQAESRLQAEVRQQAEARVQAEARLQAEAQLRAEAEAHLQAERARHRRLRVRIPRALRQAPAAVLGAIASAVRRLLPQPRPEISVGTPDLRPFPRLEAAPAEKRAA